MDFEKLGIFYLGRRYDPAKNQTVEEPILYDSRDLTTHAAIIGMTGSGKTGLGIALLEEAAIDQVPVIAIDPKGDLGNLLLTFPDLSAADFEPWVDTHAAAAAGQAPAEFAQAESHRWREGITAWGQSPERIRRLRSAAECAIYTPGSTAGRPLSVLGSLSAPPPAVREDPDLYRQHLQTLVTGLLSLVGIEGDPVASREHILLSRVLDTAWADGRSPDLPALVGSVREPGIRRIGVLDLESFYPAKDRFALALRLNNLLAAPGFEAWTRGEPLQAAGLFHTPAGRPRVAVISIAHLGDAERMFVVTLLLNEIVAWMRSQPGTSSLRAILYMDEVFGYLPPVAAPPSKQPLLTLLKQARAAGLGVVLATQNPVDLDYKALANAGTWFIGRLQTARDRQRVRDGLLSAAADRLDADELDNVLGSLGKRCFLLHNVHEAGPVVMQTRWTLSWLRGPLTRDEIRRLEGAGGPAGQRVEQAGPAVNRGTPPAAVAEATPLPAAAAATSPPVLPPDMPVLYAPARELPSRGERLVYQPQLMAAVVVHYLNARQGVDLRREQVLAADLSGAGPDWSRAELLDLAPAALVQAREPDAAFAPVPAGLASASQRRAWQAGLLKWLRTDRPVLVHRCEALDVVSAPDEPERDFRIRLRQAAREQRDLRAAAIRRKFGERLANLEERLRRRRQTLDREEDQASGSRLDALASAGAAVLTGLFGRKVLSAGTVSKVGSALRKAGSVQQQSRDVERAAESVAAIEADIEALKAEAGAELAALEKSTDTPLPLETIAIRPKAGDITVKFFGLGWLPWIEDATGNLRPAWGV